MTIHERYKVLRMMRRRYRRADRKIKGKLLGEMEALTGPGAAVRVLKRAKPRTIGSWRV